MFFTPACTLGQFVCHLHLQLNRPLIYICLISDGKVHAYENELFCSLGRGFFHPKKSCYLLENPRIKIIEIYKTKFNLSLYILRTITLRDTNVFAFFCFFPVFGTHYFSHSPRYGYFNTFCCSFTHQRCWTLRTGKHERLTGVWKNKQKLARKIP